MYIVVESHGKIGSLDYVKFFGWGIIAVFESELSRLRSAKSKIAVVFEQFVAAGYHEPLAGQIIMKTFYCVILFVLLLLEAPALAVDISDIPNEISQSYIQFRNALSTGNYEQYKSLFIPKRNSKLPDKMAFKNHSKDILDFYPDINTVQIIKLKNSINCYGIIFIEEFVDLGEENISLVLIRLKRIENKWKVSGHIGMVGFNKVGSKTEIENKIKKEIDGNEKLKPC